MKKLVLVIAVFLIATGGFFLLNKTGKKEVSTPGSPETKQESGSAMQTSENQQVQIKEIVVSGNEFSFIPEKINLKKDETVRFVFKNTGRSTHDLLIKELGIGSKLIGAGKTDSFEFTASKTGTFSFYCSVPGHAEAGMKGELVVK